MPRIGEFSKAEQVEFKFYEGKFHIFENHLDLAVKCMRFAFEKCHLGSVKNKRLILHYLVPLNIVMGRLPKSSLLKRYNLDEYAEIVKLVKQGNVKKLSDIIEENQITYIENGTLVLMDLLKLVAFRELIKKVYSILSVNEVKDDRNFREKRGTGIKRMNIDKIIKALEVVGIRNMQIYEIVSVLNNLISREWMKARIDMISGVIVLPENPFPRISSLNPNEE
jgi:nuclear mRNA export protein PCID2/THP1